MTEPPAPAIPGLSFLRKLGTGGYADVYLYEQALPARRVAVKVLRDTDLRRGVAQRFRTEANAMAQLEHPHMLRRRRTASHCCCSTRCAATAAPDRRPASRSTRRRVTRTPRWCSTRSPSSTGRSPGYVLKRAWDPDGRDELLTARVLRTDPAITVAGGTVTVPVTDAPQVIPFVVTDQRGAESAALIFVAPAGGGAPALRPGALIEVDQDSSTTCRWVT